MTVTNDQIAKAKAAGLHSVDDAADVADAIPMSFYQLCALLEKESNGKNVYGADIGGTFSGFKDPVTEANYRAFRHEVIVRGMRSNGVGPLQATYKGFLTDMEDNGLRPWVPRDSIGYLAAIYWSYYRKARAGGYSHSSAIRWGGTWFNAGPDEKVLKQPYADTLLVLAGKWRGLVGIEDTTN